MRGHDYLLATRGGADRTYRISRIRTAEALAEPAQRPADVDLDELWRQRCAQFLSEGHLEVHVRVEVAYEDSWHAEWSLWQLGSQAEALAPQQIRSALRRRAEEMTGRYAG